MGKEIRYRISSFKATKVWGHRDFDVQFLDDVTVLIGANGTGKTTILTLLQAVFEADAHRLLSYDFKEILIRLASFSNRSTKRLRVTSTGDGFVFQIGSTKYSLSAPDSRRRVRRSRPDPWQQRDRQALLHAIQELVPFVWLPVNRHLPSSDEVQHRPSVFRRSPHGQWSVDHRLHELLRDLQAYRLGLESQVSEHYRDYQRDVLLALLYRADFDSMEAFQNEEPLSKEDQKELTHVFSEARLLDAAAGKRVREHFERAAAAHQTLHGPRGRWNFEDIAIIPLIRRTRSLVDGARRLRARREETFSPINRYQELVNGFLRDKSIEVGENGRLSVRLEGLNPKMTVLPVDQLSSGEKQILILLTAALIQADAPTVYVADEPELSLHVTWQAKLLPAVVELGGQIQVIVATHSPDIAGAFHDNLVELQRG
ncbi:MAG: ATP-binding protein [Gemmatimonadetes bacterium]|nr:ATP-binding protein [Gemmatimonadota bacterium]